MTRVVVGVRTNVIGVIGTLSVPSGDRSGWGAVVTAIVALTSLPVGAWITATHLFRRRVVIAFVAWSDVPITVCMVLRDDRLTALGGTSLFAVVTTLAAIATSLRVCIAHFVYGPQPHHRDSRPVGGCQARR